MAEDLSRKQKVGAAIAAACLVCAPLTAQFEGFVPKAEPDPIGIPTGCFGERVDQSDLDPSRIYTRSECTDRLRARMAKEYAPQIAACVPELAEPERRNEFAAMIDTSYSAGPVRVCRSPVADSFRAHQWAAGCSSLRSYFTGSVTAQPVRGAMTSRLITSGANKGRYFNQFRGLVRRRAAFADLCSRPELPAPTPPTPADYQRCVTIVPAPIGRSPRHKYDFRGPNAFTDRGIA
jgi:lysozyme